MLNKALVLRHLWPRTFWTFSHKAKDINMSSILPKTSKSLDVLQCASCLCSVSHWTLQDLIIANRPSVHPSRAGQRSLLVTWLAMEMPRRQFFGHACWLVVCQRMRLQHSGVNSLFASWNPEIATWMSNRHEFIYLRSRSLRSGRLWKAASAWILSVEQSKAFVFIFCFSELVSF